jgi:hypothetical protein
MRTVVLSGAGQFSADPKRLEVQSNSRIRVAISPSPARNARFERVAARSVSVIR